MTDLEFLNHCSAITKMARCGLTSHQITRLLQLAGDYPEASWWSTAPNHTFSCASANIIKLIARAYVRLRLDLYPDADPDSAPSAKIIVLAAYRRDKQLAAAQAT